MLDKAWLLISNFEGILTTDAPCTAGLTNSFWLPEGAVVLQLIPYGWELKPGELIRSVFSADLAPAIGGYYRQVIIFFIGDTIRLEMSDPMQLMANKEFQLQ